MASMIAFIVVLLAAYASSAPVVSDLHNATLIMEVENTTTDIQTENATILTPREASEVSEERRAAVTVGLSSSEESDSKETTQTTDKPSERDFEDASMPSDSETNNKRGLDIEVSEPTAVTDAERSVTDEEQNVTDAERSVTDEERSFTEETLITEDTKRGIEVESFESSTADDTSVPTSSRVKHVKRSFDNQPWLGSESDDARIAKRSLDNQPWLGSESDDAKIAKRSLDNQPWLGSESSENMKKRSVEIVESSTDVDETSTAEGTSVPSTSEMSHAKHGFGGVSSLTTETSETFNRRAIGSVESVEAGESSTVIVIKVQPESTTDEQSFSSTVESVDTTEAIRDETGSTSDYETTVRSIEESTTASRVPSVSTPKILAIIPGTISKTQIAVQPAEQMRLTQVQNQTMPEENKSNN